MSNVRQYNITVPDGVASTDTALGNGITVTSVHFIKTVTGAAGDTAQLLKDDQATVPTVTPITTATSLNAADQTTIGPDGVLIDTTAYVVAATDLLRITTQFNTNCSCQALVTGIPNTT
jgi:hypothetical protein